MQRLADSIAPWATCTPDNLAIADDWAEWTYRELDRHVSEAAAFLAAQGVRAGDRVMLIGENSACLAALILGAGRIDAWAVLENARRASAEIDGTRAHSQPRRVIYVTASSAAAAGHAERHGATAVETLFGALAVGPRDDACMPEPAQADAGQVAVMIYTTGSTGTPKGVMLTHANLLHIATLMQQLRQVTGQDRVYGVLPITHVMGLSSGLIGGLLSGASIYLVPRFDPKQCLRALDERRITILQGAPAMFSRLISVAREQGAPRHCLRFIAAGGAPLDPAFKRDAMDVFGLVLHNGYGLTEASATSWTRLDLPGQDNGVGPPTPGMQMRIVDASGADVPRGEVGELRIKGPNVMRGYYRAPEQTRAVLAEDGWFNTEDLAREDALGQLHIAGRGKDIIIRSGFNVYPLEVETALNAHPDVQNAAVLGQSRDGNEDVVAIIECRPGRSLTAGQIREFLVPYLSPYKRPGKIIFMDTLPTAPNGKVLKQKLKQILGESL